MHFPSSSDYMPFDSNAVGSFKHSQINIYFLLAVMTIVLYDHIITIDMEVARIWTLRWSVPKLLFLASRYVVVPLLIITVVANIAYPLPSEFCNFDLYFHQILSALSLLIVELILSIRVSALYSHSKTILCSLGCLYTCLFASIVVEVVFNIKVSTPIFAYEFLPGCWTTIQSSEGTIGWSSSWWIPFICFDGVLLALTLVKVFPYQKNFNPTIRILARDSVFYYALMFFCLLENVLVSTIGTAVNVNIRTEWVACIATSRLIMNIHGLNFNDPHGTREFELSTLVFHKHDHKHDHIKDEDEL